MGCDWLSRLAKNGQRGFFSDNGGHELITIVPTLHRQACGETRVCLDGKYGICIQVQGKGAGGACPAASQRFHMSYTNSQRCTYGLCSSRSPAPTIPSSNENKRVLEKAAEREGAGGVSGSEPVWMTTFLEASWRQVL